MANYISTHTGQAIDETIDSIQNNTFSQIMYGQTPPLNTSDTTLITSGWYNQKIINSMSYQHPIGYIFEWSKTNLNNAPDLTTPEKVEAYFGYGKWELFGEGRVAVGLDPNNAPFNIDGGIGGEATHILSTAEMPAHTHGVYAFRYVAGANDKNAGDARGNWSQATAQSYSAGGGLPHNNLQPYIVVYRYRRIG